MNTHLICFICIFLLTIVACSNGNKPEPEKLRAKAKVTDLSSEWDIQIVNGNFDGGYKIGFIVMNTGNTGSNFIIRVVLNCDDGKWTREREYYLDKEEANHFVYFFHEPKLESKECQYFAEAYPK